MKRPFALLKIFVYGSLKRGFIFHEEYCGGALSIEPAAIRGTLFEHPSGFPIVKVNPGEVLAEGTADPIADMAVQEAFRIKISQASGQPPRALRYFGNHNRVRGELMTFHDPEVRLPSLDGLEGFQPDEPSLYRRVLLPVKPAHGPLVPAWVYVLGTSTEALTLLHSDSWIPTPDRT